MIDLPPIRDGANTDLFRTMSPIVSVPTSGMQLAEAKEVFKAIFHAVGLQSRNNYVIPSESCSSGSFSLNSLDVNIVENNEGGEETPPGPKAAYGKNHFFSRSSAAFCLERLQVDALLKIASTVADSSLPMVTFQQQNPDLPKESQWDIQLGHVTQVVNIAIIRLVMQLTETFDMVKEEKRFAQKIKSLEMLSLNTREKPNESPEKVVESDTEMPKSWRTMYNVLDLYATNPAPELGKEQVEEEIGSLGPKSGKGFFVIICISMKQNFGKFVRLS